MGLIKSLDISLSTEEIADILRSTGRVVATRSTIGPVIQLRPALDKVIDNFLPFATFKDVLNHVPGDSIRYATTLMRPLRLQADADSTVLPPLVQLSFVFKNNGRGRVYYTSNIDPENPWVGDITYSADGDKVIIKQSREAAKRGGDEAPFLPATFTVGADSRGKSLIERIESESIPETYTPYIKKV